MITFNILYEDTRQFGDFIQSHIEQLSKQNILVQIFAGITDEGKLVKIAKEIKEQIPQANIIGTTTAGEIFEGAMLVQHVVISLSVFENTQVRSNIYGLSDDLSVVDSAIDELVDNDTKVLIVFSDGLRTNGEDILKKITDKKPEIIIAGGRAGDNQQFQKTFVFNEKGVLESGFVMASLSSDNLHVHNDYILHWYTLGKEMLVTKSEGNVLYEINNTKVLDIYKHYLGDDIVEDLPFSGIEFPLIYEKKGLKIARAPIAVSEDGALVFGGNLEIGTKVQFGFGDIGNIKNNSYEHYNQLRKVPIESIFIYSCSARKALMNKSLEVEFGILQQIVSTSGFFTYGEYFHSNQVNELLNITTTFLALSETEQSSCLTNTDEYEDKYPINKSLQALTKLLKTTSEELNKANKLKSEFLANMSHEIRTPMNSVIGMTQLALDGELSSKQRNYIKKANIAAENLLGIINDILDFSKIEAGKMEFFPVHFALTNVIMHTLHIVSVAAKDKDLSTRVKLDQNVPKYYYADSLRLGQVLTNLASNAVKFSHAQGSITFDISLVDENDANALLKFSVMDEGIGISEENQKKLFQSFSQADSSTQKKFGGTGLGLAISKSIVQLMDGEIWVDSKEGEGSTFSFTIRLEKSNEKTMIETTQDVKVAMTLAIEKLQGKRILLVEDNELNQELAIDLLETNGLKVTLAENGQEALNLLEEQTFDIVLMDVHMPIMDGYEATKILREQEQYKDLPILAMTANVMSKDKSRARIAGMSDHIGKPIAPAEMFITMAKWV